MSDASDPTVPIVDDEPEIVDLYATFLDPYYSIKTATSGTHALTAVDEDVDVVLLDRRMPKRAEMRC